MFFALRRRVLFFSQTPRGHRCAEPVLASDNDRLSWAPSRFATVIWVSFHLWHEGTNCYPIGENVSSPTWQNDSFSQGWTARSLLCPSRWLQHAVGVPLSRWVRVFTESSLSTSFRTRRPWIRAVLSPDSRRVGQKGVAFRNPLLLTPPAGRPLNQGSGFVFLVKMSTFSGKVSTNSGKWQPSQENKCQPPQEKAKKTVNQNQEKTTRCYIVTLLHVTKGRINVTKTEFREKNSGISEITIYKYRNLITYYNLL